MKKRSFFVGAIFLLSLIFAGVGESAWVYPNIIGSGDATSSTSLPTSMAVAYVDDGTNQTYYSDLGRALNDASLSDEGETIYVIPSLAYGDTANFPNSTVIHLSSKYASEDGKYVVNSGDTLCLPYSGTTYKNLEGTNKTFADSTLDLQKTNLKTEVILDSGVTLEIKSGGRLNVGGITGNAEAKLASETSGSYCQISMMSGSSIINYGTIDCVGYIKEYDETAGNHSDGVVFKNGSNAYLPIVFYDYKGGDKMKALYSANIFPIFAYDFPNIQTKTRIEYGSRISGYGGIYIVTASVGHINTTVSIFGPDATDIFQITSGYLEYDYTPSQTTLFSIGSRQLSCTVNDFKEARTSGMSVAATTEFYLEGTVSINDISVDFSNSDNTWASLIPYVLGTSIVSTEGKFFPICYKYHFDLGPGTYSFPSQVSFLPGSRVDIGPDATINVGDNLVFIDEYRGYSAEDYGYPTKFDGAICVNNGTIKVPANTALGGTILTSDNSKTARIVFDEKATRSVGFLEISSTSYVGGSVTSYDAKGYFEGTLQNFSDYVFSTSIYDEFNTFMSAGTDSGIGSSDETYYNWMRYPAGTVKVIYAGSDNSLVKPTFAFTLNGSSYNQNSYSSSVMEISALVPIGEAYASFVISNISNVAYLLVNGEKAEVNGLTYTHTIVESDTLNTIEVIPAMALSLSADSYVSSPGTAANFTIKASVSGGIESYSYTWSVDNQDSSILQGLEFSGDTANLSLGANPNVAAERFIVTCVATDSNGATATSSATFSAAGQGITAVDLSAAVDTSSTSDQTVWLLSSSITGGSGTYNYTWASDYGTFGTVDGDTTTFTPNSDAPEYFSVSCGVSDQEDTSDEPQVVYGSVVVSRTALMSVSFTYSSSDFATEACKTGSWDIVANPSGGSGDYDYEYSMVTVGTLPSTLNQDSSNRSKATFSIDKENYYKSDFTYQVKCIVTDRQTGVEIEANTVVFTATKTTSPLSDVTLSNTSGDITSDGGRFDIEATVTGGSASLKYVWNFTTSNGATLSNNMTSMETTSSKVEVILPKNEGSNSVTHILKVTVYDKNTDDQVFATRSIDLKVPSSCFADGTLIAMGDGSQKKIEDVSKTDTIIAFNHETGKYEETAILALINHGKTEADVLTLAFSDGTELDIVGSHGLFDYETRNYVDISSGNVDSLLGHRFVKYGGTDSIETVVLESYETHTRSVNSYSIMSYGSLNAVANGMLTVTPNISQLHSYFEMDENLRWDQEQMAADIATYGLFTYEEWSEYISEEMFYGLNAQYIKISVGKGLITMDEIYWYLDYLNNMISSGELT